MEPSALTFHVLSDEQIQRLIEAALEGLARTGVHVGNAEARALLGDAGAQVEGARVRIPARIIQDALAAARRGFELWGRAGGPPLQVTPGHTYFGPGPTCTYFIDPQTGERRKARRGDAGLTALLCDALEQIDYVMSLALLDDVTPALAPVYECAEMIANSGKPILAWAYAPAQAADIYEIAAAVAGGREALRRRPNLAFFASSQAPLMHTDADLANLLWAVEHDLPVVYLGGATAGSTGPITAAGVLVIYLMVSLSGLAILQLKKRGAPVCLGGVPGAMDLRTARPAYGAPEMSLFSAGMADISRYLGLPCMGTAGASEAKLVDSQAAAEYAAQALLSGLSGATLVHDVGFLDCADIGSLEALVLCDEIIAMSRRILRGIEVSDETLMLEAIDRLGPGGQFLAEEETARRCRREIWSPRLFDRQPWVTWMEAGAPTMEARLRARVGRILAEHRPPALPAGAAERIAEILAAAEARERRAGKWSP